MYEEIARVPLIVHMLGKSLQQAATSDTLASYVNIVPTLLDMAGLSCPASLDGHSLRATLEGGEDDLDKAAFIEFNRFEISNDSLGGFFQFEKAI